MADYTFNIAKGKVAAYVDRVKTNDPATSALIIIPLSASGTEAQGQDLNDVGEVLADPNFTEITTGGWTRKTITDTEITTAPTPNDTDNRMESFFDNPTWATVTAGTTTGVLLAYDSDTGTGTDANLIPLSHHTFAATGNGGNITLQVGGNGFHWTT